MPAVTKQTVLVVTLAMSFKVSQQHSATSLPSYTPLPVFSASHKTIHATQVPSPGPVLTA